MSDEFQRTVNQYWDQRYRAASVDTRRMAETNEDSARGEARVARSREAGDAPDTSPSPPSSPQDQTQ